MIIETALATFAAFVAGFVDAIAGGGGIITLPALILLGLPEKAAIATNKMVSTCGATAAATTFVRAKRFAPEVIKWAMPATAIGALTGAWLVTKVPSDFLKPLIAVVICLLAVYFWFKPQLGMTTTYTELTPKLRNLVCVSSFLIGFYDGFLGPGTGAFFTFMMVRYLGFDFVHAAGNTKILNWTSNIIALTLFIIKGKVLFTVALPMAAANLFGGYCGAHFAVRKGSAWVRYIFLFMALALVARLVIWR